MSDEQKEKEEITTTKPLVFISHDTRDADFAEAFSNLLKSVSAGVLKSFRSSDKKGAQGIEYGVEWYPEIIKNIQHASDVVCLLTEYSIDRPWILFEAGMAKGKLDTSILGIALGIPLNKASTGPFAQFQNCGDDADSLTKLVFQLVDRIPNSEPDEETIRFQVGKFKEKIDEIVSNRKTGSKNSIKEPEIETDNNSAKLFEEIKVMFQDLPERINRNIRIDSRSKKRRFHPMMIDELIHMCDNRYVGFMIALSLYKDTMPWIYEIGMETIKTIRSLDSREDKKRALRNFEETVMMSAKHPMFRDLYMDSKDDYIFIKQMPLMLKKNMDSLLIDE